MTIKGTEKVPEVSIRDQIKKLVELQSIDVEIYNLRRDLKEKPNLVAQLKEKFEDKKADLKKFEDKLKALLLDRKAKELDLQGKESEITKNNTQLSQVKTNKEYQAKLNEIEHLKADKSIIEEKILILFDEGDTVNAAIDQEKKIVLEQEKDFFSQKKIVEETIQVIEKKLTILETQRRTITPDINPAHLSRYERILENKDGLALVPVKAHACGGCFMNVPEQVINEIKMRDRFVDCEMCARILYLEDDL